MFFYSMIARRYILKLRYLLNFSWNKNEKKIVIISIMYLLQSLFLWRTQLWQPFLDFDSQLL